MDAVKFATIEGPNCQKLETFRVFPNARLPELTTPNLGVTICEKDRPFFWSRQWHDSGYNPNEIPWAFPLLYVFDMNAEIGNIFQGPITATHTLQIGVLDVLSLDHENCTGCNGRTINEIHIDTQRMLVSALRFVSGFVYGDDFGDYLPTGFYHRDHLQYLLDDGQIEPGNRTRGLLSGSEPLNKNPFCVHVERPAEKIYGTALEFKVKTRACINDKQNFILNNWAAVPHNVGCKNC